MIFFNRLSFSSFRFTGKLSGKYSCHISPAPAQFHLLTSRHQCLKHFLQLVKTNTLLLTKICSLHQGSLCVVYSMGFDKHINDMYLPSQYHIEQFHCHKKISVLCLIISPSLQAPSNHFFTIVGIIQYAAFSDFCYEVDFDKEGSEGTGQDLQEAQGENILWNE